MYANRLLFALVVWRKIVSLFACLHLMTTESRGPRTESQLPILDGAIRRRAHGGTFAFAPLHFHDPSSMTNSEECISPAGSSVACAALLSRGLDRLNVLTLNRRRKSRRGGKQRAAVSLRFTASFSLVGGSRVGRGGLMCSAAWREQLVFLCADTAGCYLSAGPLTLAPWLEISLLWFGGEVSRAVSPKHLSAHLPNPHRGWIKAVHLNRQLFMLLIINRQ